MDADRINGSRELFTSRKCNLDYYQNPAVDADRINGSRELFTSRKCNLDYHCQRVPPLV